TTKSSAIAMLRRRSCGRPSAERIAEAVSVKSVKLATSPAMIAYGRRLPPAAPPASTIGSTGRTHGETAVITPATNPISSRRITGGALRSTLRRSSKDGLRSLQPRERRLERAQMLVAEQDEADELDRRRGSLLHRRDRGRRGELHGVAVDARRDRRERDASARELG